MDSETICLFDVDGTLTKPRQVIHMLMLIICVMRTLHRALVLTNICLLALHKTSVMSDNMFTCYVVSVAVGVRRVTPTRCFYFIRYFAEIHS